MIKFPTPRFIRNMKVSYIVWLIAFIGLALAAFFAQTLIRDEARKSNEMHNISALVELSTTMSDYVHEQQKERGATAIFLSSNGRLYREELRQQRGATDLKLADVREQSADVLDLNVDEALKQSLRDVLADTQKIAETRAQIDALSIARGSAIGFYTGLNRKTIDFIGETSRGVSDPSISKKVLVYSAFLTGKDSAGIERALGASGFAVGQFGDQLKQNWGAQIAAQNAMFTYFSVHADAALRARADTILSSELANEVQRFRDIGLNGTPDQIAQIGASDWFDLITQQINALKSLELEIASSLRGEANTAMNAADQAFWSLAIILSLMVLVQTLISVYFAQVLSRLFKGVLDPLRTLAQGDTNVEIPTRTNNEFGEIIDALEVFKANERQRQSDDQNREQVLDQLASGLHALSDGDFIDTIDHQFPESYERLRVDFNASKSSIANAMIQVATSVDAIRQGSMKVRRDAGSLSERTEGQAATLEETAAALEQMTASVKSTSESVIHTSEFVTNVEQGVLESRDIAQKTVATMTDIENSSNQISQIVTVIEEIAFQTNLLALNAGVEAARAGEAGRGFDVVASEVRALAGRSAEAAKEITSLIEANASRVGQGVVLIQSVSDALEGIVEKTTKVSKHVSDISVAAHEQSLGLSEINAAMSQLDQVTQQNASMVEQTTSFSVGLSNDAEELMRLISGFKIHGAAPSGSVTVPAIEPTSAAA